MRHVFIFFICFVLGFLYFVSTGLASKKSTKEINALLDDEKKELIILKEKIANQDKLISSAGRKEGQLLRNLRKMGSSSMQSSPPKNHWPGNSAKKLTAVSGTSPPGVA